MSRVAADMFVTLSADSESAADEVLSYGRRLAGTKATGSRCWTWLRVRVGLEVEDAQFRAGIGNVAWSPPHAITPAPPGWQVTVQWWTRINAA